MAGRTLARRLAYVPLTYQYLKERFDSSYTSSKTDLKLQWMEVWERRLPKQLNYAENKIIKPS